MDATEKFRAMLDERGVEWEACRVPTLRSELAATFWYDRDGNPCSAVEGADDIPDGKLSVNASLTPEQAIEATLGTRITGETSDGYHTFNELYRHRAVLFSVIVRDHQELAWKSKLHHDGTMYDGMFIVGVETPQGQATYHYDIDQYWDMFDCREFERAPEWDGHTPSEAIERISTLGRGENEQLRKERDALDRLTDVLNATNDGLLAENAKLRELVRIMHGELVSCEDNGYVCGGHKFDERVRELGVEV